MIFLCNAKVPSIHKQNLQQHCRDSEIQKCQQLQLLTKWLTAGWRRAVMVSDCGLHTVI